VDFVDTHCSTIYASVVLAFLEAHAVGSDSCLLWICLEMAVYVEFHLSL
jgi:hypothetical protein